MRMSISSNITIVKSLNNEESSLQSQMATTEGCNKSRNENYGRIVTVVNEQCLQPTTPQFRNK